MTSPSSPPSPSSFSLLPLSLSYLFLSSTSSLFSQKLLTKAAQPHAGRSALARTSSFFNILDSPPLFFFPYFQTRRVTNSKTKRLPGGRLSVTSAPKRAYTPPRDTRANTRVCKTTLHGVVETTEAGLRRLCLLPCSTPHHAVPISLGRNLLPWWPLPHRQQHMRRVFCWLHVCSLIPLRGFERGSERD